MNVHEGLFVEILEVVEEESGTEVETDGEDCSGGVVRYAGGSGYIDHSLLTFVSEVSIAHVCKGDVGIKIWNILERFGYVNPTTERCHL